MATGVAHGLLRCVFGGCLAASDMEVRKRPYHKYCGCAFHDRSKTGSMASICTKKMISYPFRRSLRSGGLVLASNFDQYRSHPGVIKGRTTSVSTYMVDDCFAGRHGLS